MIKPVFVCLLLFVATASPASASGPVDVSSILKSIARPSPSTTPFVELRASPLLKQAVRTEGVYRHPAPGVLVREVSSPRPETMKMSGQSIEVTRSGKTRQLDASSAPGMLSMQEGFMAMISGDLPALSRHYDVNATGDHQAWVVHLTPIAPALRARVRTIELMGSHDQLRCIITHPPKGPVQYALLGQAAAAAPRSQDIKSSLEMCHAPGQETAAR